MYDQIVSRVRILRGVSLVKTFALTSRSIGFAHLLTMPIIVRKGANVRLGAYGNFRIAQPYVRGAVVIEGDSKVVVNGTMIVKGKAVFGRGSEIFIAEAAVLTIGSNFSVTGLLSLNCLKSVTFGDDCLLSWGITILDSDFHKIFDAEGTQINHDQAISIGNKVWLGNNLIILKGVTISEGIVVGSGSVVAKSLDQEKAVYAGNPPRVLRTDITWKE